MQPEAERWSFRQRNGCDHQVFLTAVSHLQRTRYGRICPIDGNVASAAKTIALPFVVSALVVLRIPAPLNVIGPVPKVPLTKLPGVPTELARLKMVALAGPFRVVPPE